MLKPIIGEFYRNRRGTKVGPVIGTKNPDFPFRIAGLNGGIFYTADGRVDPKKPSVADLVELWFTGEPAEIKAPIAEPLDPIAVAAVEEAQSIRERAERIAVIQANAVAADKPEIPSLDLANRQAAKAPADQVLANLAEGMAQVARSTGIPAPLLDAPAPMDHAADAAVIAKPRGRPKGVVDKAKAVEDYAQVKRELAEKFDKPVRAPKVKKSANMAEIKAAVAEAKQAIATSAAGYEPLISVLNDALKQAAEGKGKERHANNKPFDRQPIAEIGRMVGVGYNLGQAMKKAQEAKGMTDRGEDERAIAELLGVINYAASAVMLLRE